MNFPGFLFIIVILVSEYTLRPEATSMLTLGGRNLGNGVVKGKKGSTPPIGEDVHQDPAKETLKHKGGIMHIEHIKDVRQVKDIEDMKHIKHIKDLIQSASHQPKMRRPASTATRS